MAVATLQSDAVIARVGRGLVVEHQWRPEVTIVAMVALSLRREVGDGFAGCGRPVVTSGTGSGRDIGMVEARWQPCGRRMTDIAFGRRLKMSDIFARRRGAVVAAGAGAYDMRVVDCRGRRESRDVVAILADIVGLYMIRGFADRVDAVVTTDTVAGNVVVIKIGRQPGDSRVAVVACVCAGDVIRGLAGDDCVVVTARAFSDNLKVVDLYDRRKGNDRVTVFANI